MLVPCGNFEIGKKEKKNKQIVNTPIFFNLITGKKVQRRFAAKPEINSNIEKE